MPKLKTFSLLFVILISIAVFSGCAGAKTPVSETVAALATDGDAAQPETVIETEAETAEAEILNPVFSHEGGLYTGSISLTLSVPDGASGVYAIRYTVNGDEPTKNSVKYDEEPVLLLASRDSVVVRAACFSRSGDVLGNIVTNTYIKNTDGHYSTLIVSISSDGSYLNGTNGIISHPTMSGKEWERPSHIEILDTDGNRVINQDAGLRIFGGSSRTLEQKSFRLVARNTEYFNDKRYNGEGSFDYAFFDNRTVLGGTDKGALLAKYDRLILRNGGNDSMQATCRRSAPHEPAARRDCQQLRRFRRTRRHKSGVKTCRRLFKR